MKLSRWILGGVAAVALATGYPGGVTAAEFSLKCGHDQPPDQFYPVIWGKFKQLVEEQSKGRIAVTVIGAAQLGDEAQLVENLKIGSVDCAGASVGNIAGHVPPAGLLGVPYIIESKKHRERLVSDDGPLFKAIAEIVSQTGNFRALGITTGGGVRSVYNSKKPVMTPDDLKGLKIRTMTSDVQVKSWKALGAVPTALPYAEVYTALLTGVVDGAENPPMGMWTMKHYEGAKYFSLTNHMFGTGVTMLSEKTYQKLPADLRAIVMQAGAVGTAAGRAYDEETEKKFLQNLAGAGVKINEVNPEPFAALTRPLHEQFAKEFKAENLLKIIRDEAAKAK